MKTMDAGQHADSKGGGLLRSLLSFIAMVLLVLVLSWLLREFIVQPYEIPSGSMEETIMIGDKLFSERITYYFNEIEPGDIVTFEDIEIPGRILIKRCVAVGGQTIDFIDGQVYIDGVAINEPYTQGKRTDPFDQMLVELEYPYTIPEGSIWAMGDNRTNSKDSRYFGPVEIERITGKAWLTYWPFDHFGLLN